MSALDIPESQVLQQLRATARVVESWLHFVLLRRVDKSLVTGRWLALLPDGLIESVARRRVFHIQRAVHVNLHAPSLIGPHMMTEASLDVTGGANTTDELEVTLIALGDLDEDEPRLLAKQKKARAIAESVVPRPSV